MWASTLKSNDEPNTSTRRHLHSLSTQLYNALESNTDSLVTFLDSWATFEKVVRSNIPALDADVLENIYTLASTVEILTSNIMDLESTSASMRQEFQEDISKILEQDLEGLTLTDYQPPEQAPYPTYIQPSYQWLLSNLHCPYPSKDDIASISKKTGYSSSVISKWFMSVRKRIGWNKLRKRSFANRRKDIVNAATQYYTFSRPLNSEHEIEFVTIELKAKDLYAGKFRTLSAPSPEKAMTPTHQHKSPGGHAPGIRTDDAESSSRSSLLHAPISDSVASVNLMPYRKRHSSVSEEDSSDKKPTKRARYCQSILQKDDNSFALPVSTVDNFDLSLNDDVTSVTDALFATEAMSACPLKRKRRLSNSATSATPGPKRPCNSSTGPPLQSVSDSVVSTFDIPWFQEITNQDEPIRKELEPTELLDISVHNFSTWDQGIDFQSDNANFFAQIFSFTQDVHAGSPDEVLSTNQAGLSESFAIGSLDFNEQYFGRSLADRSSSPSESDFDALLLQTPPHNVFKLPNEPWVYSDSSEGVVLDSPVSYEAHHDLIKFASEDVHHSLFGTLLGTDGSPLLKDSFNDILLQEKRDKQQKLLELKAAAKQLEEELAASA